MAPFPIARTTLDYPICALDFDPQDANRIIVGGGGGPRKDVPNKLTVLETTSQDEIQISGELKLDREEDNVASLAVGPRKGKSTCVYANVNSSPKAIAEGKNQHLRAFSVEQAKARVSAGNKAAAVAVTEASRTPMLGDTDSGTYQPSLRVAGGLGVTASALGKLNELAVFDAAGLNPKLKALLELPTQAEDLDIIQISDTQYKVAFCYRHQLHVVNVGKENGDPELAYQMHEENGVLPEFRFLRFLTPDFVLAVSNLPKAGGIVLQGLRLPGPGEESARLAVSAKISRKVTTLSMAVTNLSPPPSPDTAVSETQFVIAVTGSDSSISLFTVDLISEGNLKLLRQLLPFYTIQNAHNGGQVTRLAFSTFVTPKTHLRPQFIKLASTSVQFKVEVYSIPLKRYIDTVKRNKNGPPRATRYVVDMKPQHPSPKPLIITLTLMVLAMAVVWQGFMEMYGNAKPILHIHKVLPSWHGTLRSPEHQPPVLMQEDQSVLMETGDSLVYDGTKESSVISEDIVVEEAVLVGEPEAEQRAKEEL
ncbi:uncharacterized protein F5Z01DRAFT_688697 [Emericellopsis atlantica]|uniref:Guanine nucleotide-exchange factor SEC12 n=1 Tax=Emericellopsis atlantica TaxID=2614577 RepID=A0A9P8CNL1_9HYPO|nr:uncharacterized protein F5Z01DRAFT_688697 [Emericellopsis atlantica]KAG9253242.1 hypothetical protein F5Z01DRAFT_688697 [Emericellopsis atlantica]